LKEQYGPVKWWERVRGRAPEILHFHHYYKEAAEAGQRRREMVPVVEPNGYETYDIAVLETLAQRVRRWMALPRRWALAAGWTS